MNNTEAKPELILEIKQLTKEYRLNQQSVPVLKGIDLKVYRGEILAILGQSGVGKSTLLNLIGLLDQASSGHIIYKGTNDRFHGKDLCSVNLKEKAVIRNELLGFVFQAYHLLPDLTVRENVLLPAMIRYSGSEFRSRNKSLIEKADHLLERVGLSERREFPPTRLSGGERQRAAIARALFNDPELVLCDEPTGNLDTQTGEKIHQLMQELNETTGASFILVTHDENLAQRAHRQVHMVDGLFA